jgi:hypothetical protein
MMRFFSYSTIFNQSYQSVMQIELRLASAYGQALNGLEAAWENQKYHCHQALTLEMATKLKHEHEQYCTGLL